MSIINIDTNTIILILLGVIIVILISKNIDNFTDYCTSPNSSFDVCGGLEAPYVGNPVCGTGNYDGKRCRPDKNDCRIETRFMNNPERICKCKLSE